MASTDVSGEKETSERKVWGLRSYLKCVCRFRFYLYFCGRSVAKSLGSLRKADHKSHINYAVLIAGRYFKALVIGGVLARR